MSIIDLKYAKDIQFLKTEVCVIGSGPAGGILAAYLAKKKIEVLVLESGSKSGSYNVGQINTNLLEKNVQIGRAFQFGGTSNLWSGRTHPLEEIDFHHRSWIPFSGWPFDLKTLIPYYKMVSKLIEIPQYNYFTKRNKSNSINFDLFTQFQNKGAKLEGKLFQWAKKNFNVSTYLLDIITNYPNLSVILNAHVSRLEEKSNGSEVNSVLVLKPDGNTLKIKARYVVLAAGGIETPNILLNSNNVKSNGIGNEHDVVGRYLSTHPKADMAAVILNRSLNTNNAFFMRKPLESGSYRVGIGFSKATQKRFKLLNHYMQFSPLMEYRANKAFEFLFNRKVINNEILDRKKLILGFMSGLGKMGNEIIGRVIHHKISTNKFILRGFLDQYPNKENRVMVSFEKNKTNKVNIKWRYTDDDKESVLKFFSHLDKVLKENNLGKVEYSRLQNSKDWPLIGIHSHFMGTTRMGTNIKTSVTNENALVHGSRNLYIAGPSLFPTYGFANPFLTIGALSLKLGDYLLKQIKKRD